MTFMYFCSQDDVLENSKRTAVRKTPHLKLFYVTFATFPMIYSHARLVLELHSEPKVP
jgi:hypothetical protein